METNVSEVDLMLFGKATLRNNPEFNKQISLVASNDVTGLLNWLEKNSTNHEDKSCEKNFDINAELILLRFGSPEFKLAYLEARPLLPLSRQKLWSGEDVPLIKANITAIRNHPWFSISAFGDYVDIKELKSQTTDDWLYTLNEMLMQRQPSLEEIKALIERNLPGLNAFVIEKLGAQFSDEMEKFIQLRNREDELTALYANPGLWCPDYDFLVQPENRKYLIALLEKGNNALRHKDLKIVIEDPELRKIWCNRYCNEADKELPQEIVGWEREDKEELYIDVLDSLVTAGEKETALLVAKEVEFEDDNILMYANAGKVEVLKILAQQGQLHSFELRLILFTPNGAKVIEQILNVLPLQVRRETAFRDSIFSSSSLELQKALSEYGKSLLDDDLITVLEHKQYQFLEFLCTQKDNLSTPGQEFDLLTWDIPRKYKRLYKRNHILYSKTLALLKERDSWFKRMWKHCFVS